MAVLRAALLLAAVFAALAAAQRPGAVGPVVEELSRGALRGEAGLARRARAHPASGVEVTRKGWGERIMESFGAAAFGVVLFFFTFSLLMANEGTFVTRLRVIDRVREELADAGGRGDGDGVYHGTAVVKNSAVTDDQFGVCVSGLRLKRTVEMFQYKEQTHTKTEKDNFGGGEETRTTYTLTEAWLPTRQELSGRAPGSPPGGNPIFPMVNGAVVQQESMNAQVEFNGLWLSDGLIAAMEEWQPVGHYEATPVVQNMRTTVYKPDVCSVYIPYQGPGAGWVPNYGGVDTPASTGCAPAIGDVRVSWEVVKSGEYSILAERSGGTLQPHTVRDVPPYALPAVCYPCACCGVGAVLLNLFTSASNVVGVLRCGKHTADELLTSLQDRASCYVWCFRVLGCVLFYAAAAMILSPIAVVFDLIGFLGSIAAVGTSFVALLVALTLTPLTIAVCWVAYRPYIACLLVALPLLLWWLSSALAPHPAAPLHPPPYSAGGTTWQP
eukprot:TRINITY_DN1151_c1_g2_i1.p1 TRINITY_DN1151_c1_g2~~TRINITY_DN1151_c1_g2_i1.p1  ORF type:complete len:498 (+),score=173.29 TRINITY_DN1151_c1_g2_i1:46-1539(+)